MGRRRQGNPTPQKTNNISTEDLVENEGNEYMAADPSGMMISISKKFNEDLKVMLKEELSKLLKEELMEELQKKLIENKQKTAQRILRQHK
jgi:hypothetical protein